MEQHQNTMAMLKLVTRPAFCVKDGVIVQVNTAAQRMTIEAGMPVLPLLSTGQTEYADFSGGCLYLTLQFPGAELGASVESMDGFDVFIIEDENERSELKAMALAAQTLRKPLSSVMTMAGSLLPIVENAGDPDAADSLARLNRGLFQMLRILGNMSDADRFLADSLPRMETRDITSLLGELFGKLADMADHAGIELRFENLQDSLYCLVDSEKLERAVYNIFSNAMKFTPKGGNIRAKLTKRENCLYLTVQDSGAGIPEAQRSSVYTRFLRQPGLDDSRQGIGLGMMLIRSVAANHGGAVLVVADDPGLASSQNEQDTRMIARAAHVPVLEPSDSGEAKEFVKLGYAITDERVVREGSKHYQLIAAEYDGTVRSFTEAEYALGAENLARAATHPTEADVSWLTFVRTRALARVCGRASAGLDNDEQRADRALLAVIEPILQGVSSHA